MKRQEKAKKNVKKSATKKKTEPEWEELKGKRRKGRTIGIGISEVTLKSNIYIK